MKKIGLLSDTHGYFDPRIPELFCDCEEIWHAGDFGSLAVSEQLANEKPLRGVYGNIDGPEIRDAHPLDQRFECEGLDVWITHIGGYPGKYESRVFRSIRTSPPGLFISGHSHLLRVKPDKRLGLLHLNPGAAGNQGVHVIRTMMVFEVANGKIENLKAVDLGPRGKMTVQ